MAITIDRNTDIISIPQADLTPLGGTLFELDTEAKLRADLNALAASEEGIVFPDTHKHDTETVLAGVTYARKIELLSPFTITFSTEGAPYRVNLVGSNNNVTDVLNLSDASVIPSNSAGLIKVATGSGTARPQRGQAFNDFTFVMFGEGDRKPKTGLTVTGQIKKGNGSFAALTNAPTEVSNGVYEISALTAAEMTADVVTLLLTAPGAVAQILTIVTSAA